MKAFGVLYLFEWKKILGQGLVPAAILLGVLLLLAANISPLLGTGYYYRYDAQRGTVDRTAMPYGEVEKLRRDSLRALSGQVLDEALMDQLKENYRDSQAGTIQWNLNAYVPFLYLNTMEDQSGASAEDFYRQQAERFQKENVSAPLTDAELAYWQEQAAGLGPMYLDYAGGWQAMAEHCGLLCQVVVLLVTVALCRFCSEEHRARTDQLVLSSEKGKTTAFWARCAAGVSFAVGIALVFSALQMALCGALYGMDGFAAPLQLWVEGSFSALHVSMGQFVLILLGLLVLACGMTAVFVMLLSELFGTAIPALVIPFALSAASILELFVGNGRWMEQAASYLPFLRVSTYTLQDYYLVTLGSFQLNSIQFSVVLYLLLAGLFGLLYRICHRRYQVTGR